MNDWRRLPITRSQIDKIIDLQEHSELPLPPFRGGTRGEASDYIEQYTRTRHITFNIPNKYMYERGLSDDVIELFDIGYDKETDSLTFPVRYWGSVNFGTCMFVARRQVTEKLFNIPNSIEKPLYGMYEIWLDLQMRLFPRGISLCDKVYVCEGLFDCLRLWCNGKYAVAGFGCLFSQYQITLLEGLPTRHLILALDNDEAGRKATQKLRRVIKNKLITEVIIPDGKKDIGELTDEEIQHLEEVF